MDENIHEIVVTVKEFLFNITGRIDDISCRYKQDGIFDDERIVNLIEDLGSLAEGLSVINEYFDYIDLSEFGEKIDFMNEALERKDTALFNDILLFELKPLLEFWKNNLAKV